jgi:hypothetical protein
VIEFTFTKSKKIIYEIPHNPVKSI